MHNQIAVVGAKVATFVEDDAARHLQPELHQQQALNEAMPLLLCCLVDVNAALSSANDDKACLVLLAISYHSCKLSWRSQCVIIVLET